MWTPPWCFSVLLIPTWNDKWFKLILLYFFYVVNYIIVFSTFVSHINTAIEGRFERFPEWHLFFYYFTGCVCVYCLRGKDNKIQFKTEKKTFLLIVLFFLLQYFLLFSKADVYTSVYIIRLYFTLPATRTTNIPVSFPCFSFTADAINALVPHSIGFRVPTTT